MEVAGLIVGAEVMVGARVRAPMVAEEMGQVPTEKERAVWEVQCRMSMHDSGKSCTARLDRALSQSARAHYDRCQKCFARPLQAHVE